MKLLYLGAITTGLVVTAGIFLVAPALFIHDVPDPHRGILLFEITDSTNLPDWCKTLATKLNDQEISGSIFISGKLAQQYPDCIKSFGNNFDVGSQTYSYVVLPTISDYLQQLEEVKKGKQALDEAGDFDSKLFRAPNETTDQNIYSLLSRSGIIADFSYENQYNVYDDGQFIRYDLVTTKDPRHLKDLEPSVVLISFDNTESIQLILDTIEEFKKESNLDFVKPSDLVGQPLTVRPETTGENVGDGEEGA